MAEVSLPEDLPDPPAIYDPEYMSRLVGLLQRSFEMLSGRRAIYGSTANINRLPTASTGLRSGDLWNDSGTVKIVT